MKHILTTLLLLFSLTISAQTTVVTGPKKKQQTTAPAKPKPATPAAKPQPKQTPKSESKPKPQQPKQTANKQPSLPPRTPQELRTETFYANGVSFKMCYVKGGTFLMGATSEQGSDAESDEKPAHRVTVSDFYIGQTEVTQALWQAVMGKSLQQIVAENNWSTYGIGDNYPMYDVSWNDCQTFIEKLNSLTGRTFRLPTEAEWEFASRGGNNSRGYKYSGSNYIDDVAWYTSNSNGKTHTVGTKQPNELGIYDMSGNVWEWCSDWYDSNYYKSSDSNNPRGAYTGSYRVFRGGSWFNFAGCCRVSHRGDCAPGCRYNYLGLRLVLVP